MASRVIIVLCDPLGLRDFLVEQAAGPTPLQRHIAGVNLVPLVDREVFTREGRSLELVKSGEV